MALLLLAAAATRAQGDAKAPDVAAEDRAQREDSEAVPARTKSPDQKAFAGNWEVVAVQLKQPLKQGQRLLSVGDRMKFQGMAFAAPGG